jgi:hypothetical protein
MVADALARPLRWVRRASVRLLTGLAAVALATALGVSTLGVSTLGVAQPAAPAPAAPAPVVAAASAPVPAATDRVAAPAPVDQWLDVEAPAPQTRSDDGPAGGRQPLAVGERAPPAARA